MYYTWIPFLTVETTRMIDDFFFALYITAPIFCILGLGIFLLRVSGLV